MENKKYIVITTLTDGTEIVTSTDYNWGHEDELNDPRKSFVNISGNTIRKKSIKSIVYKENEKYIESNKEENNE